MNLRSDMALLFISAACCGEKNLEEWLMRLSLMEKAGTWQICLVWSYLELDLRSCSYSGRTTLSATFWKNLHC